MLKRKKKKNVTMFLFCVYTLNQSLRQSPTQVNKWWLHFFLSLEILCWKNLSRGSWLFRQLSLQSFTKPGFLDKDIIIGALGKKNDCYQKVKLTVVCISQRVIPQQLNVSIQKWSVCHNDFSLPLKKKKKHLKFKIVLDEYWAD